MRSIKEIRKSWLGRLLTLAIGFGLGSIVLLRVRSARLPLAAYAPIRLSASQAPRTPDQASAARPAPGLEMVRELSDAQATLQEGTLTVWVPEADPHYAGRKYSWKALLG